MPQDAANVDDDDLPGPAAKPEPKAAAKPQSQPRPQPQPEPEPQPTKHTHTSRLVKLATDAGFTQADLDGHPSHVIWEELERIGAIGAAPPPEPKKAEPPKPEVDPEEAYLLELEASHAPLVKMLRTSKAELAAVKKAQADKDEVIERLTKAEQARLDRMRERVLDAAFAALPEEYHELVGTGPITKLDNPAHTGWRGAIYKAARLTAEDGPEAISAKVLAAAKALGEKHVKPPAAAGAYDTAARRKPQARDPETQRFTAADFNNGHTHRPNGKQAGLEALDAVEGVRRILKETGDPRGDSAPINFDDDDLPL